MLEWITECLQPSRADTNHHKGLHCLLKSELMGCQTQDNGKSKQPEHLSREKYEPVAGRDYEEGAENVKQGT